MDRDAGDIYISGWYNTRYGITYGCPKDWGTLVVFNAGYGPQSGSIFQLFFAGGDGVSRINELYVRGVTAGASSWPEWKQL